MIIGASTRTPPRWRWRIQGRPAGRNWPADAPVGVDHSRYFAAAIRAGGRARAESTAPWPTLPRTARRGGPEMHSVELPHRWRPGSQRRRWRPRGGINPPTNPASGALPDVAIGDLLPPGVVNVVNRFGAEGRASRDIRFIPHRRRVRRGEPPRGGVMQYNLAQPGCHPGTRPARAPTSSS